MQVVAVPQAEAAVAVVPQAAAAQAGRTGRASARAVWQVQPGFLARQTAQQAQGVGLAEAMAMEALQAAAAGALLSRPTVWRLPGASFAMEGLEAMQPMMMGVGVEAQAAVLP